MGKYYWIWMLEQTGSSHEHRRGIWDPMGFLGQRYSTMRCNQKYQPVFWVPAGKVGKKKVDFIRRLCQSLAMSCKAVYNKHDKERENARKEVSKAQSGLERGWSEEVIEKI